MPGARACARGTVWPGHSVPGAMSVLHHVDVYYTGKKIIKQNDIIVVNAASGALGSILCQWYKNKGGKVIAITGGKNKKKYLLNKLGLYACIDKMKI